MTFADLRDAMDKLRRGEKIAAAELHTYAVLKALGLSTTECKAVWLHFRLRSSKPRPPREVAAALKIREGDLPSLIDVIRRKVPAVSFPVH